MKDLFQKYISNVWKTDKIMAYTNHRIRFDYPECRTCLQIDGKIRLLVTGVSENGRKKMVFTNQKTVSTSRNKVIFEKLDFHWQKKKVPIKECCFK